MRIISVVTTCPRFGANYLPDTLGSLRAAGFDPEVVEDTERAGSWPTLRRALAGLLERRGDMLAVFQDDILIARGCREWLEWHLSGWDIDKTGVISLYTPKCSILRNGWIHMDELAVYRPFGACALVFPKFSAEWLLEDNTNSGFMSGSDTSVATFCRKHDLKWWMHSPSLVQHIGQVSAIGPKEIGLDDNRTAADDWCRDVTTPTAQRAAENH